MEKSSFDLRKRVQTTLSSLFLFDISLASTFHPLSSKRFMSAEEALAPTRRHQHILPDGRVAYEWSQSLNDVTVFVPCPEGVRGRDLDVCIERKRCRLGLKGNPPYLDVSCARYHIFERAAERKRKRRARARERKTAKRPWKKNLSFPFISTRDRNHQKRQNRSRLFKPALSTSAPPKSQHATFSVVKASESFWTLGEMADWLDEKAAFFRFFPPSIFILFVSV